MTTPELNKMQANFFVDIARLYAISGNRERALFLLEKYKKSVEREGKPLSYLIAVIYTGLGEKEPALDWLEKAYRNRNPWMIYLKVDPRFDDLRADSRFHDLLRRIGFERAH